ncbi:hypothetical protein AAZX31_14G052000 [Glycine max]|uniref:Sororin C-terminal region domain-containing protein n=1 Tax=Glycine soja TaxID=3848 RepID=A0A0B2SKA9_GLYSO|nr:uncharacterized protein LOC114385290 [Glycine soja]KAG4964659.1 hypothetical protein JHK85_039634 [Glycine max]KAG4953245.1 hypothetical protein JHK87_038839 [Glycine soja]KAG5109645.1 hypothetical protein JHK82_038868 [Glycine max]KAG5120936.1 hypothetical protein JHK84_039276 [Glycine max]KAH1093198.1 hypothetical protein GYH30_039095 [Glycine max]
MEASNERRVLPRRKPLSDRTNTSSPSAVPLKPLKTKTPSSAPAKCTATNLDSAPNPTSPSPSLKTPSPSLHEIVDVEASEPITVVYSRRRSSNKRKKDKGKAVAVPFTTTPNFKISHTCDTEDEFEGVNLPKAKAMTVPRTKKQRALSSEKDEFKDHQLQEFIQKQKAYFKEIDEFELEVESGDELD